MVYGWHIYTKTSQETCAIMLLIIMLLRDTGKFLCAAPIRLNIKNKEERSRRWVQTPPQMHKIMWVSTGSCKHTLWKSSGLHLLLSIFTAAPHPCQCSLSLPFSLLLLRHCWGIAFPLVCLLPLCSLQSAFRREAEWLYNLPDRTITSNNAVQGN